MVHNEKPSLLFGRKNEDNYVNCKQILVGVYICITFTVLVKTPLLIHKSLVSGAVVIFLLAF